MGFLSRPGLLWASALALALTVPALLAGAPSLATPLGLADDGADGAAFDRRIELNVTAVDCPTDFDNEATDDVCLAYDGQIPGPTLVFREGERVNLTLNHRVNQTVANTTADADLRAELSDARYSLHRHGTSVAACEDGVSKPQGTQVCDSAVPRNGTVHYAFETPFPGAWHYHDHALGVDAGVEVGPVLGAEAEHRGLFGSFLVVPDGEAVDPGNVFDLHLLDAGANGGLGLDANVDVGDRFDVIVVGLGDHPWRFTLEDPSGDIVRTIEIGPGLSRAATVTDAEAGVYSWTAQSVFVGSFSGEVTVG